MRRSDLALLLVDADPQANATLVLLEGRAAELPTLRHVLLNEAEAALAIRPTHVERLALIPADAQLADANLALAGELGRERRLRMAMEGVARDYDFVLIDTSPQRSLVNVNALNYAAELLVPLDPGLFSLAGLDTAWIAAGWARTDPVRHQTSRERPSEGYQRDPRHDPRVK